MTLLNAALDYAANDYEIFPVNETDKTPYTEHGMKDATTDADQIRQWWQQHPKALIGCRIPEDVVVLDIDPRYKGGHVWLELERLHGSVQTDRVHASGREDGGRHYWFNRADIEKLSAKPLHEWARTNGLGQPSGKRGWTSGIDVLHHGWRYTILPPSPHPHTGKPYRWLRDGKPSTLPAWLAEMVTRPTAPLPSTTASTPQDDSPADWYSNTARWSDILVGWLLVEGDGETDGSKWRHPAATASTSASIKHGCLFVYTPNTDLEETEDGDPHGYTKFRAWAELHHGGDLKTAAAAAREARDGPPAELHLRPSTNGDTPQAEAESPERSVRLTPASAIKVRRVRWLWAGRLALGTIALLSGPEGMGKSTLAYWLAARLTRGELPGEYEGTPRSAFVCATEDSWAHTVVPRLMAHNADLERVFRVDVVTQGAFHDELSLPRDLNDIEALAAKHRTALLLLDPLMSRLDAKFDTHRDGEVRQALEPLALTCDNAAIAAVGLIHHNKSGSTDPLQLVMASKAFTAVARSVHTVIREPDESTGRRLFGTPKNNLGRSDLPVLSFNISQFTYDTDDGPGTTGQLVWGDDFEGTIHDALRRSAEASEHRGERAECMDWLKEYMQANGAPTDRGYELEQKDVRTAADEHGFSLSTLKRARSKLGVISEDVATFGPRQTRWILPVTSMSSRMSQDPEPEPIGLIGADQHTLTPNRTDKTNTHSPHARVSPSPADHPDPFDP